MALNTTDTKSAGTPVAASPDSLQGVASRCPDPSSASYSAVNKDYPRCWWTGAWSSDVKKGRAVPLRILERDIVLWRDREAVVHAQAAHCPHLGAHLGYGGEVVEDGIRCPFHGRTFGANGEQVSQPGPDRVRPGSCLPTFRVVERFGAIFFWNGAEDVEFPDVLGELGLCESDLAFSYHRWFLPFSAKSFAENQADGMHFAIMHDTAAWGDTKINAETPARLDMLNVLSEPHRWLSLDNVKRRLRRGELVNLLTPLTDNVEIACYGAGISRGRFEGRGDRVIGTVIFCLTPVDRDTHLTTTVAFMPKVKIPIIGPYVNKTLSLILRYGNWTTIRQDAAIMIHRKEPDNPPYGPRDKGLVAYRRFWDSQIDTDTALIGDGARSNGSRAGIRVKGRPNPSEGLEPGNE